MELELTVEAQEDQADAYEWYELDQPGRGERFVNDLQRCYAAIIQFPTLGVEDQNGLRIRRLERFKDYGVIYKLASSSKIMVVAIWHGARNPQTLSGRFG